MLIRPRQVHVVIRQRVVTPGVLEMSGLPYQGHVAAKGTFPPRAEMSVDGSEDAASLAERQRRQAGRRASLTEARWPCSGTP